MLNHSPLGTVSTGLDEYAHIQVCLPICGGNGSLGSCLVSGLEEDNMERGKLSDHGHL